MSAFGNWLSSFFFRMLFSIRCFIGHRFSGNFNRIVFFSGFFIFERFLRRFLGFKTTFGNWLSSFFFSLLLILRYIFAFSGFRLCGWRHFSISRRLITNFFLRQLISFLDIFLPAGSFILFFCRTFSIFGIRNVFHKRKKVLLSL